MINDSIPRCFLPKSKTRTRRKKLLHTVVFDIAMDIINILTAVARCCYLQKIKMLKEKLLRSLAARLYFQKKNVNQKFIVKKNQQQPQPQNVDQAYKYSEWLRQNKVEREKKKYILL